MSTTLFPCKECNHMVSKNAKTCPNCGVGNPVKKGFSLLNSIGYFILFCVIGLFLIGISVKNEKIDPQDTSSNTTKEIISEIDEQATDKNLPIPEVTAAIIANAYDENTVLADQQFKNKPFKVSGVVTAISTDFMGEPYISLRGGVNQFMEPMFKFDKSNIDKLSKLKKGQKVTLICIGDGDVAKTPISKSCKLL